MHITTRRTLAIAASLFAASWISPQLQANEITGSIGFGSLGVNITGSSLASASSFTLNSPFITTESGGYAGVSTLTPVTFGGFQFNPPAASVTPLWTFSVNGVNYSFDATSVTSIYDASLNEWDIGGTGIAMVTGYDATPGTWNVNLSQSGASIVFDSSAAARGNANLVPDSGATVLLLSGSLACLGGFRRRKR